MAPICVALRLRFVKLPDTSDERIFRDVLRLAADPDDRELDALVDIVDKKLSFMEISASGAEVTLFYCEDNGDRVVIDAPYYELLTRKWARAAEQARKRRARARRPERAKRPRVESETPLVLAGADTASASSSSSSLSSSSCSSSDADDGPEQTETIEIEVQMRAKAAGDGDRAVTAASARLTSTTTMMRGVPPAPPPPVVSGRNHHLLDGHRHNSGSSSSLTSMSELTQVPTTRALNDRSGPTMTAMPLTAANLAKVAAAPVVSPLVGLSSGPQHTFLSDLTCPPVNPHFYLRCVVLSIRVKLPKAGMVVTEVELCDAADPSQHITAVTFDEVVQRGIRETLRGDRRQVVELRNVTVRRKNELDMRYQSNLHPLQLRLERQCQIEVVQVLPIPVGAAISSLDAHAHAVGSNASGHGSVPPVVTVRAHLQPNGVLDVSAMAAATTPNVAGVVLGSSSSSSLSGGPRRTTFSFTGSNGGGGAGGGYGASNGTPHNVTAAAGYPSALGMQARTQQLEFLRGHGGQSPADALPIEPGVPRVSAQEVHQREALLQHHANKELERKERLRRRAPVSQRCLLCGLDLDDEDDTMARVRRLLEASNRNRGSHVPSLTELRTAVTDPRRRPTGSTGAAAVAAPRVVCKAHFVNAATRTVHVVHPRCAHLCTAYQKGDSLEDIAAFQIEMQVCTLCGMPGATVSCYHPDCKETYHVVCALFSNGYVNFGKRDPYLPCPACPRHTQVVVDAKGNASSPRSGHEFAVRGADPSCWEDDIVFDSRVVEETDLRDPDENGGL